MAQLGDFQTSPFTFLRDAFVDAISAARRVVPGVNLRAKMRGMDVALFDQDIAESKPVVAIHLRRPDEDDSEVAPYTIEVCA